MAEPLGRHLRPARRSGLTSPEPVRTPDGPRGHPDPARARNPGQAAQQASGRTPTPGITSRNSSCRNQAGNELPELTGGSRLSTAELRAGAQDLLTTVTRVKPQVVAILGITAYRTAFARPKASTGRQPGLFAGTQLWVVPNPSGLNAHSSLADLAAAYREVAIAAGLDLRPAGG